jgi:hypothetical protein
MFCLYLLSTLIQLGLGSIFLFSLDCLCELIIKSISIKSSLNCIFFISVAFRLDFKLDTTLTYIKLNRLIACQPKPKSCSLSIITNLHLFFNLELFFIKIDNSKLQH